MECAAGKWLREGAIARRLPRDSNLLATFLFPFSSTTDFQKNRDLAFLFAFDSCMMSAFCDKWIICMSILRRKIARPIQSSKLGEQTRAKFGMDEGSVLYHKSLLVARSGSLGNKPHSFCIFIGHHFCHVGNERVEKVLWEIGKSGTHHFFKSQRLLPLKSGSLHHAQFSFEPMHSPQLSDRAVQLLFLRNRMLPKFSAPEVTRKPEMQRRNRRGIISQVLIVITSLVVALLQLHFWVTDFSLDRIFARRICQHVHIPIFLPNLSRKLFCRVSTKNRPRDVRSGSD